MADNENQTGSDNESSDSVSSGLEEDSENKVIARMFVLAA